MPDIEDTIESLANSPKKASGDSGSVEMQNVSDVIEADRYLASKAAANNVRRGLRFTKLIPPGAD